MLTSCPPLPLLRNFVSSCLITSHDKYSGKPKTKHQKTGWQLLGGVNMQIFKVNYRNLILFFLTVLFCCNVGENGENIWVGNGPFHKLYKKVVSHCCHYS